VNLTLRTMLMISGFVSALSAVCCFAYPAFAEDQGFDFWNVGRYDAQMRDARSSMEVMSRHDETVLNRLERREEIIQDLLDGRLTFDGAVSQFAELNRTSANGLALGCTFTGQTEEDRAAQQLISFLRTGRGPACAAFAEAHECEVLGRVASY
jgi:hypothetical protein